MEIPLGGTGAKSKRPPRGNSGARAARKSDDTTEKVQPAGGGGSKARRRKRQVMSSFAARKAYERDKRTTETRLHGWAYRTRTRKCRFNRARSEWVSSRLPRIGSGTK